MCDFVKLMKEGGNRGMSHFKGVLSWNFCISLNSQNICLCRRKGTF